MNTRSK
jgi:predicted Kef-type K+ transport protein